MTSEELISKLDDPFWRVTSGKLYKIITKGDDDDNLVVPFIPNEHQMTLLRALWNRNIILKARQLGFTTMVSILWLDTALFSKSPIRCGIIAQDRESAESIFRDKVKFAYLHLPEILQGVMPLSRDSASELLFAHNHSSIRVATSMRSGTIHRLHVSEFGKICAKSPDKAVEVVTGSIPAVPKSGVVVIESTAEGQDGEFYKMTQRAMNLHRQQSDLTVKDYRFHFFPWWAAPEYTIDAADYTLSETDTRYFNELESKIDRVLTVGQKAWYCYTRDADFSGDPTKMWQEYPSTPEEAFQVSTDGCYYAEQMAAARKSNRLLDHIPLLPVPVNTFWDLGRGDMTAIWFHQYHGLQHRFIRYYEASGEDLSHFTQYLQRLAIEQGYVFGTHFIPHDADYRRLGKDPDTNRTIKEMMQELLPGQRFEIVPRVTQLMFGIQATRAAMSQAYFDTTHCVMGIRRLDNYKKRWNKTTGTWTDEALHDINSHGADAFRQWGQAVETGALSTTAPARSVTKFRRGSAMAV